MLNLKFALRNAFRNKRRSIITLITVAIGSLALGLFGGFVNSVYQGIETSIVRGSGQLHLHKVGYFEFGAGRATDFDIENYETILQTIKQDPILRSLISVITPTLAVAGIAGNYAENSSQTYTGVGLIPSEQNLLRQWDGYGSGGDATPFPITDADNGGFIGAGLGRILNLCDELRIESCKESVVTLAPSGAIDNSILDLQDLESDGQHSSQNEEGPVEIDLLASSASGAPNIIRLPVLLAEEQTQKAIDDRFVAMPLSSAQLLVYGRGDPRVTTIVIQIIKSADMALASKQLSLLITKHDWPIEIKDFTEFNVSFSRITNMFASIFGFITFVIAIVVLFTIFNNLSMSVMERVNEIGTLRSMGVRRSLIRSQFVLEGAVLGLAGATLGLLLGAIITTLINHSGITWTPPSNTSPRPLILNLFGDLRMPIGIWIGLVTITALSSLPPANRAAKLPIVDALRHT